MVGRVWVSGVGLALYLLKVSNCKDKSRIYQSPYTQSSFRYNLDAKLARAWRAAQSYPVL